MPAPTATRDPAPPPTAAGVMTLATVAAELGCLPLHVSRLIARGHIVPVMLGESPRVMASEVARYVSAGAKDFNAPDYSGHGWFLDEEAPTAAAFWNKALAAIEPLPQPEIETRYAAMIAQHEKNLRSGNLSPRPTNLEVKLTLTGKLAAIVNSQPGGTMQPKPAVVSRYKTWGELYLVSKLRDITRRLLAAAALDFGATLLAGLYASPEAYRAVRVQALQQLMAGAISTTSLVKIPGPAAGYDCFVSYTLPHSALTGDAEKLPALAY